MIEGDVAQMKERRHGGDRRCDLATNGSNSIAVRLALLERFALEIDRRADERRKQDDELREERATALHLQSDDYERRLDEIRIWRLQVDKDMNTQKGRDATRTAMTALVLGVLGLLISAISIFVHIAK